MIDLWGQSRSGSHAGRGFHYQDAVATEFAIRAWRGELRLERLIPEGYEDVSLGLRTHWLHLQAKSRRSHRGNFGERELFDAWRHLAERLAADPDAHVGLVLERPLAGFETGLDLTLGGSADRHIQSVIEDAVKDVVAPELFLSRAHVLIMPAATQSAVTLIAERLAIPPASCLAHYQILRGRLAELADENGVRAAADPAILTAAEIARLLDDVTEAVDPSALDDAVRAGVVELVDFATPIEDRRFYSGVDIVAGHVVAGLPLEREELVGDLEQALVSERVAIAVGPSGAGKSTLIWLTAFATRHQIQWYRVRRLREEDVVATVRLVKGLRPTGARLGFVVDDIGREDRAGYDALVEELRQFSESVVLAACREEDLFIVRTAPGSVQVRPALDEELAERIWMELVRDGASTWPDWREPYEMSHGLLLEYGYLLTSGRRLQATIDGQVNRRMQEGRALELELLALIATADTYGADLGLARLQSTLNGDDLGLKLSLARLVEEHLIVQHEGILGGLHELRSRYIMRAIHDVPPPTITETVRRVVELIDASALQTFLTRLLLDGAVTDDLVVDAVASRLHRKPDPVALAASLHALRLVGFRRMAAEWQVIITEEDVAPTSVGLIAYLALRGGDLELFPEPVQRAVARIENLEPIELRVALVARVAEQLPVALAQAPNVATAATVLASLAEVEGRLSVNAASLARLAEGVSLEELRLLLEAAYAATPELAIGLVDQLGGAETLLARLERDRPWVRGARLGVNEDGRPTAEAEYAYVAAEHQENAHDEVVELARYLSALAPAAEVAVCRAVDATGESAGFGDFTLADKAIDRRNLPNRAEVAWNRARGRAALAAVAAPTATAYASAAREIVTLAARLMRHVGDLWVRGQRMGRRGTADTVALAQAAHELAPPPIAIESAGPLEEGDLPVADPASFVGTMLPNNLIINLFRGNPVTAFIPKLVEEVDQLADPQRWRLLSEPPMADVASLRRSLLDLHAVLAERDSGGRISAIALNNAAKKGLAASADVARRRADARMQQVAGAVVRRVADAGYPAHVVRREGQSDQWPSDDFLVLVEIDSIYSWLPAVPVVTELCRPLLADRLHFTLAPLRLGRVVSSSAVKVIENIFPTELGNWPELPLPLLDEKVADLTRHALDALVEVSGIAASIRATEVHDEEAAVVDAAMARLNEKLSALDQIAEETGHPLLIEIRAGLVEIWQAVDQEVASLAAGSPVAHGVASSIVAGLKGEPNDVYLIYAGLMAASIEYDVDPAGAWDLFEEAAES